MHACAAVSGQHFFPPPPPIPALPQITLEQMSGSVLDYVTSLQGEMFAVTDNPRAAAACGCGTSFQRKDA